MAKYFDKLDITVEGSSHSEQIVLKVSGLPCGQKINLNEIRSFLKRRAPGQNEFTTARRESDEPIIMSGIENGALNGKELAVCFKNSDVRREDYRELKGVIRPSHADLAAYKKYGTDYDLSGGGRFSGRMTLPYCFLGAICLSFLKQRGIYIGGRIKSIQNINDTEINYAKITADNVLMLCSMGFPVIDRNVGVKMRECIMNASLHGDSLGGILECFVVGLKSGQVGGELFDGLESAISAAVFSIPSIKGIEFGSGFDGTHKFGSQNNDPVFIKDGEPVCAKNDHGGILGGISSGMPIVFRAAVKPTPSISLPQRTVDLNTMSETVIEIKGRHDPCIAVRALACVEAMTAISIWDKLTEE